MRTKDDTYKDTLITCLEHVNYTLRHSDIDCSYVNSIDRGIVYIRHLFARVNHIEMQPVINITCVDYREDVLKGLLATKDDFVHPITQNVYWIDQAYIYIEDLYNALQQRWFSVGLYRDIDIQIEISDHMRTIDIQCQGVSLKDAKQKFKNLNLTLQKD